MMDKTFDELLARVQNYLEVGGLFNPESMHPQDAVRDLIMDAAAAIRNLEAKLEAAERRAKRRNDECELWVKDYKALESRLREVEDALRGVMDLLKGKIRGEEWWAWERY